jgi:hypothetical protein
VQALSKDLAAALGSLPQLQHVRLSNSRGHKWNKWDFQPLLQLQQLTRLKVHSDEVLSDHAASVFCQLVRLKDLDLPCPTEQQLRGLTVLTGLTRLEFGRRQLGVLLKDVLNCTAPFGPICNKVTCTLWL